MGIFGVRVHNSLGNQLLKTSIKFSFLFRKYESEQLSTHYHAFLDQKTAEIDEAIDKKQRLIELLKEQKAILINQAVTKGLNPNVPMRDSGVEWIGEIPVHWKLYPQLAGFIGEVRKNE